ncbi:MAG: chromosomal replication initiator protein DnaA [Anaerolineae bacterium]
MTQPESAWKATLGELELQMTRATFNTWLKDAQLIRSEGCNYTIGVRNDYARDWLENRLQETILRTLNAITGEPNKISFEVMAESLRIGSRNASKNGNGNQHINPAHEVKAKTAPFVENGSNGNSSSNEEPHGQVISMRERDVANKTGLRLGYTFMTFVVGESNRLAHAAALGVAEKPGASYNPLFIYGGVGLGKTHLLHAVGHKCADRGLKVRYVTSEAFTNDLVQSIRSQKTSQFREKYRTTDVLLIDDIQFIAGKESTQEELFHTFNDLHSRGKQVVISSDRPPKAMATLQERLQSRFEWGLMTDIQMPNIEMRMAILKTKAEENGVMIPENVIEMIAHQVRHNIRELEGALNKVVAYSQLTSQKVDMQLARMALADLVNRQEKINVSRVIDTVCNHFDVSREVICGAGRSRSISYPRQIAMYLARTETGASFPQIGLQLGNRDHTTILHGYEKIMEQVETNPSVRQDMLAVKSNLYAR